MKRILIAAAVALAGGAPALAQPQVVQIPAATLTTPEQRKEAVEALAKALETDYLVAETGKKYAAALRAKAGDAGYWTGDDFAFARKVNDDLTKVAPDKHLRLVPPLPPMGPGVVVVRGPGAGPGAKAIEAAEKLTNDIAYIRFGVFPGDPETMQELEKFLADNAGVKTLIIDARGHRGGGTDEIDALFADLFAKPVDLVQMRASEATLARQPDLIEAGPTFRKVAGPKGTLTLQHFVKPSAHPRLANTKLYVLQSEFSGSAAEHLLFEVKMSERGKLVGQTSAGAGHFGYPIDLPAGYSTFIPAGRTFDPRTDKDWEGTGVVPDISVPADQALVAALKDAGVSQGEAEIINGRSTFVMPRRGPNGGVAVTIRHGDQ